MNKTYYPQVFLVIKEKKIHKYIIDDVKISSDSDEETLVKNSDGKNSDCKKNSDEEILEKIQMEKNSDEENSSEENFKKGK